LHEILEFEITSSEKLFCQEEISPQTYRAVGMGRASVAFPVLLALVGPTVVASFLTPAIGQRVLSHSATAHRRRSLSNGGGLKMLQGNAGEVAVAGFLAFNVAYVAQLLNKPRSIFFCFQLQLVLISLPCHHPCSWARG